MPVGGGVVYEVRVAPVGGDTDGGVRDGREATGDAVRVGLGSGTDSGLSGDREA